MWKNVNFGQFFGIIPLKAKVGFAPLINYTVYPTNITDIHLSISYLWYLYKDYS